MPRVILDYCSMTEDASRQTTEHGETLEATTSLTALVMKETLCGSVWAYALRSKGAGDDPWVADQIVDDMCTVGMAKERVVVKSDQEASIVELQLEIAKRRKYADYGIGTGVENNKVGDSNSNGKIERAIRDVGNMVRTLRSATEENIGRKINLGSSIVPWLIWHAAYLITRCRVRSHGKTALQLMNGRSSLTELLPFGEHVMFKIPKTGEAVGSFEDRWDSGIRLGCTIRDGMHLIGTATGVYKVGTLQRKLDGQQWSTDLVMSLVATLQRPEPGADTRRVTTFAKKKLASKPDRPEAQFQPPTDLPVEPRQMNVVKYGSTDRCPGCNAIASRKSWRTDHTAACRQTMEAAMLLDDDDRQRVARASERISQNIVDISVLTEEEKSGHKQSRIDRTPPPTKFHRISGNSESFSVTAC